MVARLTEPRTRPWTKREFYEAAERGWFDGQRVELLDGEVIEMQPPGFRSIGS